MEKDMKCIKRVCLGNCDYVKRLQEIPKPPKEIYVMGRLPKDDSTTVGVVGARNCSFYGETVAKKFGRVLAENHIPVISGMARGIDGICQREAMKNGGEVYAVLGGGVDICYPKENRDIYEAAPKRGGVLSIYPPGTPPIAKNFPPRNRIISGLADVLVVIEAGMKSGTMITVDMALEQGKDVYVVPGRINDRLSEGCNYLISQGANVVLSVESFLENIKIERKNADTEADIKQMEEDKLQSAIYRILSDGPKTVGELWDMLEKTQSFRISKMTVSDFMSILCELQIDGKIKKEKGFFLI